MCKNNLKLKKLSKRYWDPLLIHNDKNQHYCYVKDLSRLVGTQKSSHKCKLYIFRRCLQHFFSNKVLDEHHETCMKYKLARCIMPTNENSVLQLKNF